MNLLKNNQFLCGTGRFFGWGIAFGCVMGVAGSSGPIILSSAGVFMDTLNSEFGWSRSDVSFSVVIYTTITALLLPLVGRVIDKIGARKILIPMIFFSAFAIALPVFMTQLWHFYLFIALFSIAGAFTTSLPYVRVISLWFDRRRGLFLGIVAAGIGIGFMTMPILMNFLLNIVGWRGAYVGVGAVILLVIFPIILFFVRDDPADVGLKPDGRDQEKIVASASSKVGMSLSEAMKTRSFWTLLVITFVFAFVFNGMTVHFLPLLKDNGMEASQAVFIAAIIGMSMFVSRIAIGYLLDKFFAPRLAIVVFLIGAGGIALVASNQSVTMSILAAAMIGIGVGAETDIVSYMTSRYFGLRSFGKIYGFLFSFFYIGTGLGPLVLGIAYEANGSYTSTLYQFTFLCVIIILAFLSFGPYKYQQNEALENSDYSSAGIKGST